MAQDQPRASRSVTLKIPGELYDNIAKLIEGTGFRSVTEFAIHVLRDVAAGGKLQKDETTGLTAHEIQIIRDRLKALGYLE